MAVTSSAAQEGCEFIKQQFSHIIYLESSKALFI